MEKKIEIPSGVDVKVNEMTVTVKGPNGEITKTFDDPRFLGLVKIEVGDGILVRSLSDRRKPGAMAGTINAHIKNMIIGVTKGFQYDMKIFYTHFPMTAEVKDNKFLIKNFLGEKGQRKAKIYPGTEVKATKDHVTITGIDPAAVGQTAANIEMACKIGKRDRRIFQDGIFIEHKGLQKK